MKLHLHRGQFMFKDADAGKDRDHLYYLGERSSDHRTSGFRSRWRVMSQNVTDNITQTYNFVVVLLLLCAAGFLETLSSLMAFPLPPSATRTGRFIQVRSNITRQMLPGLSYGWLHLY